MMKWFVMLGMVLSLWACTTIEIHCNTTSCGGMNVHADKDVAPSTLNPVVDANVNAKDNTVQGIPGLGL